VQLRQLLKNAFMAVLQVVVAGGVYYVLYKFLLGTIGIALLGVWSIVLATTSVGRLSQLGFGPSVVRFVALNVARRDFDGVANVVHSGLIFIGGVSAVAILIFFPFARWGLGLVVEPDVLEPALELLPWALGSLWLTMIAGVYQAGLHGYQRMDLRTTLVMMSTILYLLLALAFVPAHGLMGLAWAQLVQSAVLLVATAGLLKLIQPTLPLLPTRFRKDTFRELMTYGLNVQATTALNMVLDPLTKGLLAKFGGVALVGWYEMANRMVIQLRSLLNSASEALVPAFAHLQQTDAAAVQRVYLEAYRVVFFLVMPALAFTVVATPLVSEVWIGRYEAHFTNYAFLMAGGLFLAMLSTPAFMANLGLGSLRSNTISYASMVAVVAVLGTVLGVVLGGAGVVAAFAIAYLVGASVILVSYHLRYGLPFRTLLPRESLPVMVGSVLAMVAGLLTYYELREHLGLGALSALVFSAWALPLLLPTWRHPLRSRLAAMLTRGLRRAPGGAS